jgi:hypothetical protein
VDDTFEPCFNLLHNLMAKVLHPITHLIISRLANKLSWLKTNFGTDRTLQSRGVHRVYVFSVPKKPMGRRLMWITTTPKNLVEDPVPTASSCAPHCSDASVPVLKCSVPWYCLRFSV